MGEYLGQPYSDANYIERCRSRSKVAEAEVVQRFEEEGGISEVEFGQVQKGAVSVCRNALSMRGLDDLVARGLPILSNRQSEERVALKR